MGEDYHMKTPYTQGYNLTLQYQITQNDTVRQPTWGIPSVTWAFTPTQTLPARYSLLDLILLTTRLIRISNQLHGYQLCRRQLLQRAPT